MPRKKSDNNENEYDKINKIKKEIEVVAFDYKKYLKELGVNIEPKNDNSNKKTEKQQQKSKYVYEFPLIDMEDRFSEIMDSLPNDNMRDKFLDTIEKYGLRIDIDNSNIELLIYD